MVAFAIPITILAGAFFLLTKALLTTAPAAGVAALPFWKLGGAIALIGLGIAIAAAGIGYMAEGFAGLDGTQVMGVAVALGVMAASLYFMMGAAPSVGVLAALAIPLLAVGAAAVLMGFGISLAAESLKGLEASEMLAMAAAAVAFGAGLGILAAGASLLGNPMALAGLGALTLAGGALMGIGKALGVFRKEKQATKELAPTISAFGGVSKGQFEAAEQAFAGMEASLSNMSGLKLLTMTSALNAVAKITKNTATATPTAAQTVAGQGRTPNKASGPVRETIEVKLNFENPFTGKFESEVLDIVRDEVNSEVTYSLQYGTSPI